MMPEAPSLFWKLFFEVYEALPRQGPGNRASAWRAFQSCKELPLEPSILDLGCGNGAQTLHLAGFTQGRILAIDSHAPAIENLQKNLQAQGLDHRVKAVTGDMAQPGPPPGSMDLIWSEGALYNIGLRKALAVCHQLLRPSAYLVFTDAIWRRDHPPSKVKASFDFDYPEMGTLQDDLGTIRASGFELIDHFTLPDEAWWEDFYTPMEARIHALRIQYAGDAQAITILDQLAEEPVIHREYGHYYAYEFFIVRRNTAPVPGSVPPKN
jgi:SAM-dependent methyltransferase